jgi:hypothetical protein
MADERHEAMNARLSILGLFLIAAALGAVAFGSRRGNGILIVVGVLILAMAAWNVRAYHSGRRR